MIELGELHAAIVALGPREFASRLGFKVDRRGRGRCPIHGGHNDQQFALTVKHGEVMLVHCFACGLGCDAIDFVGTLRGRPDFPGKLEAVADLLGMAPIPVSTEPFEPEPERIDPLSYHNVITALRAICLQYRPIRDVCQYLQRRKLLGLAPEFELFALPERAKQPEVIEHLRKTFEVETLAACGIIRRKKSGAFEMRQLQWSNHRLCIPWTSPSGQVEALQRRTLDSSKPKYVFASGVAPMHPFGIERLKEVAKDHPIAFVEGALDVLALTSICRREGFALVPLGLPGVSTWRESWGEICRGREVYVALDNDKAGTEAFAELAPKLHEVGASQIHWWQPTSGKDWGDTLNKVAS